MSSRLMAAILSGLLAVLLPAQAPSLVIRGARVATLDPRLPEATAVAIRGDRILAVGTDEAIQALVVPDSTRVIDAAGAFLMPGFIESHGHFLGIGTAARLVSLYGCSSEGDLVERVREFARSAAPDAPLLGRGWDQNLWERREFPDAAAISAAFPDRPVLMTRVDGHAALANRAALKLAGIDRETKDPSGGEILRDAGGEATGILIDKAMALVAAHFPQDDDLKVIEDDLLRAQAICFEKGITSFQDAGTNPNVIGVMARLMQEGRLRIRLYVMAAGGNAALVRQLVRTPPRIGDYDGRLTVRAIKLSIDGALGSRGAALLDDYADRPGHRGLLMFDADELVKVGEAAIPAGYQLCVHAIGDRANREVLDAYSRLRDRFSWFPALRPRIEHAQILSSSDLPRFAELGVIASMQGIHCVSDGPWVPERIGAERARVGAYVWRDLLDRGVVICNGTDAPVEDVSPIASFAGSVTRVTRTGPFHPEQCMTRMEALASYTVAPAYAAFEENIKGSISPGKLADLVLLDTDLRSCPDEALSRARVLELVLAGRVGTRH